MTEPLAPNNEFILYTTEDGKTRVECRFENETLWLSQALMADLFQTTPQNITLHLKALYEDEELDEGATCKDYLQVRQEGQREVKRQVKHYNLEAILAVGFRVRSSRGSQFRRWANGRCDMDGSDRIRACHQHCDLQWVLRKKMTNQSLRERFGVSDGSANTISQIITSAVEQGLIKQDPNAPESRRYARYIPAWA